MTRQQLNATEQLRLSCTEATERLVDALSVRGFQALNGHRSWRGLVDIASTAKTAVHLHIPTDYPYVQPKVHPLSRMEAETWLGAACLLQYFEASDSWHRERDGSLCLFAQEDHTRLPWADPDSLFDQMEAWLCEDRAGWSGDQPALDLERYLDSTGEVVLYNELQKVVGKIVLMCRRRSGPWTIGLPAKVPRGRKGMKASWPGGVALVLDVGELGRPIRDWTSLVDAVGESRKRLEREVNDGVRELMIVYRRGDARGVLAVRLSSDGSVWTVTAHRAAPTNNEDLVRRSHPQRAVLAQQRVAVVGLGAIGSVLADLLHRSGVGRLHLIDPDVVLPGNFVRHLAGQEHVGKAKVVAVAELMRTARPASDAVVTGEIAWVATLQRATELLSSYDLVVDASADSTASALIAVSARAGAGRAISVAVLAEGYAIRVDPWPEPTTGALAAPVLPPMTSGTYESGCSSPISTTPPAAVWEAAALGARHCIDALLGASFAEERVLDSSGKR